MSDLINFNSTNEKVISLASPLIPPPEIKNEDTSDDVGKVGSSNFDCKNRHSLENNPFDLVMKKVIEFEKNKEDPFETVCQKAMKLATDRVLIESEDNLMLQDEVFSVTEGNLKKESKKPLSNASDTISSTEIIKLEKHDEVGLLNLASESCDIKDLPDIVMSAADCCKDLSILSNSSMNDSLLELNDKKDVKNFALDFHPRHKSKTDFIIPKEPLLIKNYRRSLSVTESTKNSILKDNSINYSGQSSFDSTFNKAFRKSSVGNSSTFTNSDNSNSFLGSSQCDTSIYKQNIERFNSNSSLFSLSNISSIPLDSSSKQKKDRFSHDSSSFSSISSLSIIPSVNTSNYSSIFSNDTINRGFMSSKTHSISENKSPMKAEDLEKFYEIKTKILGNEICKSKITNKANALKQSLEKAEKADEPLIEIDEPHNSVFSEQLAVDNIISNEALVLAQTFEKLAISPESQSSSNSENCLLLSDAQIMFDDLPPSDDENVDVLIDLQSPVERKNALDVEPVEEVEKKDLDKKAEATLLLLNLESLLKENNNPNTHNILNDLQKLLGIESCNNTEILHACLPNTDNNLQNMNRCDESQKSSNGKSNLTNDQLGNIDYEINSPNSNKVQNDKHLKDNENCESTDNEQTKNLKLQKVSSNVSEPQDNKNKLDDPVEYDKLADVLHTLNQIVIGNNSQLLKNLSFVLKLAADEKENETSIAPITKKREITPKLNRSTPLRPPNRNKSLMDTPRLPEKRKSLMLNMKKRFHSNPELNNSASSKSDDISTKTKNSKPSLTRSSTYAIEPIKPKLKRHSEFVGKKGPLKAVIPLGNMQKLKTSGNRLSVHHNIKTPPKSLDIKSSAKLVSSTPNQSIIQTLKSKPSASSTPNVATVGRPRRVETPLKKLEQTLSPQIRSETPKKSSRSTSRESYLPKFSPRLTRNHSIGDLRSVKSSQISTEFGSIKSPQSTSDLRILKSPRPASNLQNVKTPRSVSDLRNIRSPKPMSNLKSLKTQPSTSDLRNIQSPQSTSNLRSLRVSGSASDLRNKKSPPNLSYSRNAKSPLPAGSGQKSKLVRRSALSPLKNLNQGDKEKSLGMSRLGKSAVQSTLGKENYV